MQFNRFTAAVLTAGALVLLSINTASAADGQFLADRHVARGVACASCHGKETPKAGAKVSTAQCNTCHQSLDAVAKQTSNSIPIRTTTIWSAWIVPNATAVTSKA